MNAGNSNHIDYDNTYTSERARRNALRRRRRKQLLIRRFICFLIAVILLAVGGKAVISSVQKHFFPKQVSSNQSKKRNQKAAQKKETEKIKFTPIPEGATTLPAEALAKLNQMAASDKRVAEIVNHYEEYPVDLLELASKNTETIDFVLNYPKQKDIPCADTIGEITKGQIPHLLQWDPRWGYGIYGDNLLAINGCGPTSLAMVASGLTGDNTITPYKVAQYAAESGLYVPESGSSWDLMRTGAKHFGLTSREVMLDEHAMAEQLLAGHPIICSMRPGDFTTTGHFIVLVGYDNGNFRILDANSNANTEKLWSYERLYPQINNLWAFSI